jgi:serine/threonine protein kinase
LDEKFSSRILNHNDIKPANITNSPKRGAVLIDFEMAQFTHDQTSRGGTPWYMPPEFATSARRGAPGDVWALGVTMLYVLGKTGLPERMVAPWQIAEVRDKTGQAYRQMMAWVDSVAGIRERLDREDAVEGLVCQMLEEAPNSRVRAERASALIEAHTLADLNVS